MKVGNLDFDDVRKHSELVGHAIKKAIEKNKLENVLVAEIYASLADIAAFCEAYDVGLDVSANCVVVKVKRADKTWYAACMILATNKADLISVLRR